MSVFPVQHTVLGGKGFVGSAFCAAYPYHIANDRNDYGVATNDVVDFISTVHNYNVFQQPYLDIETNLTTLVRALENWRKHLAITDDQYGTLGTSTGTFNFISSWFVYGDQKLPHNVPEDAPCNPKGFYSITKRCAEQLVVSYCETYGLHYRILRLGNVVGPGDKKVSKQKNALQFMLNSLAGGEPVEIYGDGAQYRDYIHVNDVARAIGLILEKGEQDAIYNIGNGHKCWSLREIIQYAAIELSSASRVTHITPKIFHTKVQVESFYMNVDKLRALGFEPEYTGAKLIRAILPK